MKGHAEEIWCEGRMSRNFPNTPQPKPDTIDNVCTYMRTYVCAPTRVCMSVCVVGVSGGVA